MALDLVDNGCVETMVLDAAFQEAVDYDGLPLDLDGRVGVVTVESWCVGVSLRRQGHGQAKRSGGGRVVQIHRFVGIARHEAAS